MVQKPHEDTFLTHFDLQAQTAHVVYSSNDVLADFCPDLSGEVKKINICLFHLKQDGVVLKVTFGFTYTCRGDIN